MNMPNELSAEARAWMQTHLTLSTARHAARADAKLRQLTEFTDGLFLVVAQLVPGVLRSLPDLAMRVEPHWRDAAVRLEQLDRGLPLQDATEDETRDFVEARALLFSICRNAGIWKTRQP